MRAAGNQLARAVCPPRIRFQAGRKDMHLADQAPATQSTRRLVGLAHATTPVAAGGKG